MKADVDATTQAIAARPATLPTLYDLETLLVAAFAQIQEAHAANQEPPQEVMDLIVSYVDAAVSKRDRCAHFLRHLEMTGEAITGEIDRLTRRKRSIEAAKERFESYILSVMDNIGVKRLEGQAFTFTAKQNPPSVEIMNTAELPEQFLRPQKPAPPREGDKAAIKKAIQAGDKVPGARLITGAKRLEVA